MRSTRRRFLQTLAGTGCVAAGVRSEAAQEKPRPSLDQLDRAAARRVLHLDALKTPVKIASLELLRNGRTYLVRARSTDGAEGIIVPNADRLGDVYPVFLNRVAPFFAAAGLAALNFLYGMFVLPESLPAERRRKFQIARANPLGTLIAFQGQPIVLGLALAALFWQLAFQVYP